MSVIIVLLLGGFLLYFVVEPFFKKNNDLAFSYAEQGNEKFNNLVKQKNELLQELKDIDLEYRMGKLSDQDYEEIKSEYENQAINILQKIETNGNGKSDKDDLELEIEIHKRKQKNESTNSKKFCSNCGKKIDETVKFCSNCGAKI